MSEYCIKEGYQARTQTAFLDDTKSYKNNLVFQPDVYDLAGHLAEGFGVNTIIDIGCGIGRKLSSFREKFNIIGLDIGTNVSYCNNTYDYGTWLELNLDQPHEFPVDDETLANAIIVCSDVIEHVIEPEHLLRTFRKIASLAPALLVSTPERDRIRGIGDMGPPRNKKHIREWNLEEFTSLCHQYRLPLLTYGLTIDNNIDQEKQTILCICGRSASSDNKPRSNDPAVLAIIDIDENSAPGLESLASSLLADDIPVFLLDCSQHGNVCNSIPGLADKLENIENMGPANSRDQILSKKSSIAETYPNTWIIDLQGNEQICSTLPDRSLSESLRLVSRAGFTRIDFTKTIVFRNLRQADPDIPGKGRDPQESFFFESKEPEHKAWLQAPADSEKPTPELRSFPLRFLLRTFYEALPSGLEIQVSHPYIAKQFTNEYLVEIISGIGIGRERPPQRPPSWHKRLKIMRRKWKTAIKNTFRAQTT